MLKAVDHDFHGSDVNLVNALGVTQIVFELVFHGGVGMRVETKNARHSLVVFVLLGRDGKLRRTRKRVKVQNKSSGASTTIHSRSLYEVDLVFCADLRADLSCRPTNQHGR